MKLTSFTSPIVFSVLVASVAAQTPASVSKPLVKRAPQQLSTQLPSAPLVGGSDACATPDTIVGTGTFSFDNTFVSSGPQAQAEPICYDWNTMQIANDVWFKWTATFTGNAEVSLCGGTTMDSRLAAYTGSACPTPGSAIACNDDYCGYQSRVNFLCTSGTSYVIQLGTYPTAAGAVGTFTLTQHTALAGDDCGAPISLAGPGTYAFDTTPMTTSFQGQAETLCVGANTTQIDDDTWYAYTASVTGTATVTDCGLTVSTSSDSKIAVYAGTACPALGSSIACNDDDASCVAPLASTTVVSVTCGQTYLIQIGRYPNTGGPVTGQFTLSESGSTVCSAPGTPYCFGDGTGTACPCANSGAAGNGCASSVNVNGAHLMTTGNSTIASDSLTLVGTGMPNSTCLYFQGTSQISAAFGDGLRCAGGSVTRLGTKTNVGGNSQYPEAGNAAIHVKGNVVTAGTRTYQVWYRNAAAFCTVSTFNLSNGVLVTWL